MALTFRRWAPPTMVVAFTAGLQLTGAVEETLGWVLIGVATLLAVAYVAVDGRIEEKGAVVSEPGDANINYGNQGVGINKGTVNVSAPQPSVSIERIAENEETDDGYATRVAIHLDQPYAASNLAVLVNRTSLKDFQVKLVGSGMISLTGVNFDGGQGMIVNAPLVSDYQAVVISEQPEKDLALQAQLNVEVQ